jgi:hypothetical protein
MAPGAGAGTGGGDSFGSDDDDATSPADDDDATADGDDDASDDDDDGTPVPYEGDTPGECDDGADNDQDGAFDCDDPDCAGAPVCQGDDDDTAGDDDETADDDSPGDDDDSPGDDDDDSSPPPSDSDGDGWPIGPDCDDSDPAINPYAWETCSDGVDEDCDSAIDCADSDCVSQVACVADDAYEPNDSQPAAYDLTFQGGELLYAVLCEPSPDWWKVCLGEGGSYSANIEEYDNPGYTPPSVDSDVYSGSTPSGFSLSTHAFGFEIGSPPGDCHWYTIELTVNVPLACP